ncbi:MAG: 4Fe-4S binding protein [Ignavibacteriales bacterium]|nr:4Fe-4S binding protein [Ignavibacteriales bacterium]
MSTQILEPKFDDVVVAVSPDRFSSSPRNAIKKLPFELRKPKLRFRSEMRLHRRLALRLKEDEQFFRSFVQLAFVLLCVWIGFEFYLFASWGASNGAVEHVARPPGVEGFLPISALMSLKYWWQTGIVNEIHPSGLFIFLAIVVSGLFLKKAFCGWLCPIGTLSESLWMLGQKLLGKNWNINRWFDYPLRSLKYLLLLFFVYSINSMSLPDVKAFIYSPYNKMADVKMYLFFANISSFALGTIMVLLLLSVFVKNFWCRYLCPYGALLGALSWLSPLKVTRTKSTCIDCELCTEACPANIKVHALGQVWSDECTGCLKCVTICPVKNTLELRTHARGKAVPGWVFGSLVVGVFAGITGLAMLTGHWQNGISSQEYQRRFQQIDSPLYQHNRGQVPHYDGND